MTASIGTAANIYTGLREISQVTNTYAGYFTSNGSAYNLQTPWQADKLEWYNFTKYATNTDNLQGVWFRDFPAANALIINRGTTTLTSTLEATNGVTVANVASAFASQQLTITGITTATPAVVTTSVPHGYVTGQRVVITKVIGTMASQVNNQTYVVNVLSSTTFGLYDVYGAPITTVGSYTSSGQSTLTDPTAGIVDSPKLYYLTLGTAIIGANSDVIYFVASKFNAYFNLGTT
jgi:hypothetical protein